MNSTWMDLNTVNLLGRVDSRINKDDLINDIAKQYSLSKVLSYNQIHEGFEDYNVKLKTLNGTYFIKIFSQYKSFHHIKDNIEGLLSFEKNGVRVPKLLQDKEKGYLYKYEKKQVMALGCVMEYFQGRSFYIRREDPTDQEISSLVKDISLINTSSFKPKGIYDVWVLQNLSTEYSKKQKFLSLHNEKLIDPISKKLSRINFKNLKKGPIHNDIQRSNVLKNSKGELRIIDFSVMEYNAIAIDLSTFLALFCMNPFKDNVKKVSHLIRKVVIKYQKYNKLSQFDIKTIPFFIKATYAANCLAASFEYFGKKNKSVETKYWLELGSKGMELMEKLDTEVLNKSLLKT